MCWTLILKNSLRLECTGTGNLAGCLCGPSTWWGGLQMHVPLSFCFSNELTSFLWLLDLPVGDTQLLISSSMVRKLYKSCPGTSQCYGQWPTLLSNLLKFSVQLLHKVWKSTFLDCIYWHLVETNNLSNCFVYNTCIGCVPVWAGRQIDKLC